MAVPLTVKKDLVKSTKKVTRIEFFATLGNCKDTCFLSYNESNQVDCPSNSSDVNDCYFMQLIDFYYIYCSNKG